MLPHLQLILLLLAFISHEPEAVAQSQVAPVTKHTDLATPLYSVQLMITSWVNRDIFYKNLLIDIDAPFTWYNCTVDWNSLIYNRNCPTCPAPVSCQEYQCTNVRTSSSYESPSCLPETNSSTLPGGGDCTCPVNVVNPINGTCGQALLNFDEFTFRGSDGKNPLPEYLVRSQLNAACAPLTMFESFPANVTGVMAFSKSQYAFPAYQFQPFTKTFGLCLPSSLSAHGVMFSGNGPYYLLPNSDVDLRSLLSYIPLLSYPDSFGYFIGVKSVVVKERSIDVSNSTTKLSTIEPYTILRTDIYKQMVQMISIATMGILRVWPVAPFGLCLKNQIGRSHVSLLVPDIVLKLEDGKKWIISSSNSMKQVKKNVACLAFVDGGATSEHGIVIGTFQMEDNFLMFDLDNSSLGFSSSLLSNKTSCANFNFTSP
ncbi:unnamed protein product [Lactuca virosa]|uniref:Peptidase A1 domain-containing protein n=1 Tax=Lactuca virosa TaxID=75947 RepID=A0AAU9LSJ5_9ASTR|nr:unnamed protein product [Lactuca virosa]